jgi:hypothetical protein
MSAIAKQLSGFIFNGAALVLASAAWKNNVRAIYGFNGTGNGYTVFKPSSTFNSLTQLSQDGVYILDAATPGFELPGAALTGATAAEPEPIVIADLDMRLKPNGYLTISSNVTGVDQLRIGSMVVSASESSIDTDPTGRLFQDMNENDGYVYLEYLKNGKLVLNYPFPTRLVRA